MTSGKQLDTIVYPQTNHTIVYHDHIHFKLLSIDFNLLAIDFNLLSSKRKKQSPQEAAGHNSVPSNKPHYCVSGLLMDYPLEKLFE